MEWNFWKKKKVQTACFYEHDMHSHLLPGLDDGVKTMDESLSIIRRLYALGISRFSVTPHIAMPSMPNSMESIYPALEELKLRLAEENIPVYVEAGAEYRVGEFMFDLIANNKLMVFNQKNVLIEHSFMAKSINFEDVLFRLRHNGYNPILAHPERYEFYYGNILKNCQDIRNRACLLQVNILSFSGFYGNPAQKMANSLFKEGLIDIVSGDIHSMAHVEALEEFLCSRFAKKLSEYPFLNKKLPR